MIIRRNCIRDLRPDPPTGAPQLATWASATALAPRPGGRHARALSKRRLAGGVA